MEISLKAEISHDKSGHCYVNCKVPEKYLSEYIKEMRELIGLKKYEALKKNKFSRDGDEYHLTLVNPKEVQSDLNGLPPDLKNHEVRIKLIGLGAQSDGAREAWYVVVQSRAIDFMRESLNLDNANLHITLGFSPEDIHDLPKDASTIIKGGQSPFRASP